MNKHESEVKLIRGDCLEILPQLPAASFDAAITDPPYAALDSALSGARKTASDAYQSTTTARRFPSFPNIALSPWVFARWAERWARELIRVVKTGGWFLCFTDWRGLPVLADAFGIVGWRQTGIFVWDKTEGARPQKGDFRRQAEYVLIFRKWGGGNAVPRTDRCAPGLWRGVMAQGERHHVTGKPVALMETLLSVLPERSRVIDPFAGSGSTLVAARNLGHDAVGIEITDEYAEITEKRLAQDVRAPCSSAA